MPKTLYEKIVAAHTVKRIDAATVLLYCDVHFANEYTSPQAFAGLVDRGLTVPVPDAHLCVVDHILPSIDESPRRIYDEKSRIQARRFKPTAAVSVLTPFTAPTIRIRVLSTS